MLSYLAERSGYYRSQYEMSDTPFNAAFITDV
jgi:hypothetical protein